MNIQILGISRSGKNYLIEHLVDYFNREDPNTILFVKGSATLNDFSIKKFGMPLSETSEEQKNELRLDFCPWLTNLSQTTNYKHIIVDGHFCFSIGGKLVQSFSREERDIFDAFFYLDTPAPKIIENAKRGDHNHDVATMSEEQINEWKETEIHGLQRFLKEIDKELIIVDDQIDDIIDFFRFLFQDKKLLWDAKFIAEELIRTHQRTIDQYEKILLIDCDKTITVKDTTYDFCEKLGIEKQKLKKIYINERYTSYQFFKAAKLYSSVSVQQYDQAAYFAATRAILNQTLIEDVKSWGKDYLSIGITSGILRSWEFVQSSVQFPQYVWGGSNLKTDHFLISKFTKYQIVKILQQQGKYVMAVGDSMVDVMMLEAANTAFLIANDKLNDSIERYLKSHKTDFSQLQYSSCQYLNVPSKKSLFL